MDARHLLKSYEAAKADADRLRNALESELSRIMEQNSLPLALLESRTKDWPSIVNKMDRSSYPITDIKDLSDFIGLRLAFLFSTETLRAIELIPQSFEVILGEDKGNKLKVSEFGYQSFHFDARLKSHWLDVPTFKGLGAFQFEIQIRTLSQHIWAVASHKLQYKDEAAVPSTARRSLYRLAALLELVDMELERVNREKLEYAHSVQGGDLTKYYDAQLNVDLMIRVLVAKLPRKHQDIDDPYAQLFYDLQQCRIEKVRQLISLVDKQIDKALQANAVALKAFVNGDPLYAGDREKAKEGVFYTYVGLVENMLNEQFGSEWRRSKIDGS